MVKPWHTNVVSSIAWSSKMALDSMDWFKGNVTSESPYDLMVKSMVSGSGFPFNQSIDRYSI
jgi:hypothetical protein